MIRSSSLTQKQRADLVAYLDGELDEPAAKEIERLIASDNQVRHEADMLVRSFELLDVLPQQRASDTFTAQTMATVRVSPRTAKPTPMARRIGVYAGWAAGLVLAAVVGFSIANRWVPDESRMLIENLPVIQNLDMYTEVENTEFLRELQASGLFDEPADGTNQ